MGIFNEQSLDHPFARGVQGAPGVGFNLTSSGDYDMINKKLRNVGAPSANTDAATKKYVDDNSSGSPKTSNLTVDSDIDMNDSYRIKNLKTPQDSKDPATKYYVDNTFLDTDGSYPMKGNLNMDNNRILNLPAPTGSNQPTPLAFTDMKYLHVAGTNKMTNNLNMDNKKIINLRPPTASTDAATKKYVDDISSSGGSSDLSNYLKKDGSVAMTGPLKMGTPSPKNYNQIKFLEDPTNSHNAATKGYVDKNSLRINGTNSMNGNINMGNNLIEGLGQPQSNSDAATKVYVDHRLNMRLKKDGTEAMTGNLNGAALKHGIRNPETETESRKRKRKQNTESNIDDRKLKNFTIHNLVQSKENLS